MKISHILQESPQQCPECGGPAFGDLILAEKKDACYSKVRSRYKVWPSAYASGALVQCRKKGAANWGNKSKNEDVAEDVRTGPQIIYATGPRQMGINDVDLVFKDIKSGKTVAYVVGNNYHPGMEQLKEFAPSNGGGGGGGGGGGDRPPNQYATYEIRMNNSKTPTYVAFGDPQQDSKHEVYKLGAGQPNGPTYYGQGLTLVSNLDWWNFLEKMIGEIMWEDDAIEAGYVDRLYDGDLVFTKQGVAESDKKPHPKTWHDVDSKLGKQVDKMTQAEKVKKGLAHPDTLKKKGVAEGGEGSGRRTADAWDTSPGRMGRVEKTAQGIRHHADPSRYGGSEPEPELYGLDKGKVNAMDKALGVKWDRESKRYYSPIKVDEQGVAEGSESSPVADAIFRRLQMQKPDLFARHGLEAVADAVYAVADSVGTVDEIGSSDVSGWIRKVEQMLNNTNENYNAEYDDEAGMADNNLETLSRAVAGIDELIQSGDNLPEWCQEKIAVAKSMLVSVWDYMYSEEASDEVDPEIDAMYEAMDQLAEEIAAKEKISVDQVWESFESLSDHMLYETAAWRRKEGKSKTGGLNLKGVASYRRENPGSKLQMAVTTKPSKLKPGSKAAKRRKSFCARMSGVKGPMKKPNGKPTRKALALRKWNC